MRPISIKPITTLSNSLLHRGQVIASYGKRYQVELADASVWDCVTRGKKHDVACGDWVDIKATGSQQAVIERIQPRRSLLFRSNVFRSKVLAANVTQILFVLASQPSFYEALLNRCLIAASHADIRFIIVLNKNDLPSSAATLQQLQRYQALGYLVLPISAQQDCTALLPYLQAQTSILVGQSGMGKSTLINGLLPEQQVRTREISDVLDSGKHTTTASHLYHLNANSHIIDTPGLQEFGLHHLELAQLQQAFVEFRPLLGQCRFNNCRHQHEPDCAVLKAHQAGDISTIRLETYHQLLVEWEQSH